MNNNENHRIEKSGGIVCAGVSCLDLFLLNTTPLLTPESCSLVESVEFVAGGSTSNTGRAIAQLSEKVELLTLIGDDSHGEMLIHKWQESGIGVNYVQRQSGYSSALSVLPVYQNSGKRGIYFCSGTNRIMNVDHILNGDNNRNHEILDQAKIFHYGYPHLSSQIQREQLKLLFQQVKSKYNGILTALDVNGADSDFSVIEETLPYTDIFHANIEEALTLCGTLGQILARRHSTTTTTTSHTNPEDLVTEEDIRQVANEFISRGAVIVTITLGARGVFTTVTGDEHKLSQFLQSAPIDHLQVNHSFHLPAFKLLPIQGAANTTGAGDSFVGGLLASIVASTSFKLSIEDAIKVAQICALLRLSGVNETTSVVQILNDISSGRFEPLQ